MRKAIVFVMSICLIFCILPTQAVSAENGESPAPWATDAVDYMASYHLLPEELMSSYSSKIRRDEFAAALVSIYNEACQNYHTFDNQLTPLTDIQGSPYADYIKKAYIMGFIKGTTNTTFSPQNEITREDVAAIILRFIKLMYPDEMVVLHNTIADKNKISAYASEAVEFCMSSRLMNGIGNNLFNPKGSLTRQEAVIIMYNICKRYQIIENGRGSAFSAFSPVCYGLHETIDGNYLYIKMQSYPFSFNGSVMKNTECKLIRTPLGFGQQNKGEILLSHDYIEAYAVTQDRIFFCDRSNVYSMDKNGGDLRKIRDLSFLLGSIDIPKMQVEGSWIFIGAANSIIKLHTDGTCISYLEKEKGSAFKCDGQYLYTATSDPQSTKYSIQINRISITGDQTETLYSYERNYGMIYAFYPYRGHVYLALYNYDDIDNNNKLIRIDSNNKSSDIVEDLNNQHLISFGADVYIGSLSGNLLNMTNISGGTDFKATIPTAAQGNIALIYDHYIVFFLVNSAQQYTRYYSVFDTKTMTYGDIYGNGC